MRTFSAEGSPTCHAGRLAGPPPRVAANVARARAATPRGARSPWLCRGAGSHRPGHCALGQRGLAIPPKRLDRAIVSYLTRPETDALIAAPDRTTWLGRRDHALPTAPAHSAQPVSMPTVLTLVV